MSELTREQAMLAVPALAAKLTELHIPFVLSVQDPEGQLHTYVNAPTGTCMEMYCAIFDLDKKPGKIA